MSPVDLLRQYAGALNHDPDGPNTSTEIQHDLEFIAHLIETRDDLDPLAAGYRAELGLCLYGSPLWQHHCLDCKEETLS